MRRMSDIHSRRAYHLIGWDSPVQVLPPEYLAFWAMSMMLSRDLCNKFLPVIRQFPAHYQVSEDFE
jgi:hypothetical protein